LCIWERERNHDPYVFLVHIQLSLVEGERMHKPQACCTHCPYQLSEHLCMLPCRPVVSASVGAQDPACCVSTHLFLKPTTTPHHRQQQTCISQSVSRVCCCSMGTHPRFSCFCDKDKFSLWVCNGCW
jgi:hypothetical protein